MFQIRLEKIDMEIFFPEIFLNWRIVPSCANFFATIELSGEPNNSYSSNCRWLVRAIEPDVRVVSEIIYNIGLKTYLLSPGGETYQPEEDLCIEHYRSANIPSV